ncbi:MAG: DUF2141 domain-containing protein [Sphingomonas sp.]
MNRITIRAAVLAVTAVWCIGAAPVSGILTVRVTNVRNAKGVVHVDICPEANFLKETCPYSASAPAHPGMTLVLARGIPAGRYAAQVFHDENLNHKVDRALFGIPKEGVGFSNDAPIHLSPPKWTDAVFAYNGGDQTIQLKTRYFLGPSGPQVR